MSGVHEWLAFGRVVVLWRAVLSPFVSESALMASEASPVIWTAAPPKRGAMAFAGLFAVESFARSLIATVVSVQAHDLLRESQRVSVLFTCVSIIVLTSTVVLFPFLFRKLPRRWAYTLGVGALITACIAFATFTLPGQVFGMYLRNAGAAILNISLSLYILDHIRRADLVRSEPLRLTLSTLSWTVGPFLGVWLYERYGHWAPQALSIGVSFVLVALFWRLRLGDHPVIRAAKSVPQTPLKNIRRFIRQPRLRLAWLIAFGRSCFWSTFFIYGPLLMIEGKLGKEAGGLLISAGNAVLCTAFLFGKLSERVGVRVVIAGAFAAAAAVSLGAGLAGVSAPVIAALFLLCGSIATCALDGVGGIPFLRAVRAYERPQMTAVYRTYIDFADLIPSFIYSFALLVFPLGIVFIILALGLLMIALIAWVHLPRTM
jgi:Major Facilitator Superfamily